MADLRQKKHIFFDFDDTLWDFQKNSGIVLEQLFAEYALREKLNADFEEFFDKYKEVNLAFWSRYYKRQIDKHFIRNHRFHETFLHFGYSNFEENLSITQQYLDRTPRGSHLKEGCVEVLEYLSQNYSLHVITNGFKEVQDIKLENCGLRPYFNCVLISEEHQLVKPEEAIFRLAERLTGAQRHECVMIGDSLESDVEGALNAGWDAIFFSHDHRDFKGTSIRHLLELKELF
jgi:putative hydrolase of the HAD superfamily